MFKKTTPEPDLLEVTIASVHTELEGLTADSPEYSKAVDQLDKLYKMKSYEKTNRVSKDALIAVAGNLAGIVMILSFERTHVIATKALGFVGKFKL